MFTGIITAIGQIVDVRPLGSTRGHGRRLAVETSPGYVSGVQLGDSIALNGACMTVTHIEPAAGRFEIEISAESLARTSGLEQEHPPRSGQMLAGRRSFFFTDV